MNKALLRILCPVLMVASGLAFAFAFSPETSGHFHVYNAGTRNSELRIRSGLQPAAFYQAVTPTPTPKDLSVPGSTDGIVLLSVVIVTIILVPLLLQKNMWKK